MEVTVYTIVLSTDITPLYKELRNSCKGYDIPMYSPLEGGDMQGCYYLVATPIEFTPDHMTILLEKYKGKCQSSYVTTFPKEHFNHHYEVSLQGTMGMNLGCNYTLCKVSPIYYGNDTILQDTEEYKSLFDDDNI